MKARDIREFQGYLDACTDKQVQGVYEKEKAAHGEDRKIYAELARTEMRKRGLV